MTLSDGRQLKMAQGVAAGHARLENDLQGICEANRAHPYKKPRRDYDKYLTNLDSALP